MYRVSYKIAKRQMGVFLILFGLCCSLFFIAEDKGEQTFGTLLTFGVIGIFALFQIISECKRSVFSANMFHWIFILFFLFISPCLQYITGSFALNYSPTSTEILKTNGLIITWELCYSFAYSYKKKKCPHLQKNENFFEGEFCSVRRLKSIMPGLILGSTVIAICMLSKGGLDIMVSRSSGEGVFSSNSSGLSSLLMYALRNFVTFSTAFSIIKYKKDGHTLSMVIMFVLLCITCSPFGMPRFQAATIYVGLLLVFFPRLANKLSFFILLVFGLLVLFPLVNAVRYVDLTDISIFRMLRNIVNNLISQLTNANYDAYVMIMKTQNYVIKNGFSFGYQLLGVLLFWVPRSLWNSKPYGSGYTIHISEGIFGGAANVSCPLPGEAYMNFGIVGIVLFAWILGYTISKLDYKFWYLPCNQKEFPFKSVYVFIPVLLFFMMRGDLMSTTSYVVSYIVVGGLMSRMITSR